MSWTGVSSCLSSKDVEADKRRFRHNNLSYGANRIEDRREHSKSQSISVAYERPRMSELLFDCSWIIRF